MNPSSLPESLIARLQKIIPGQNILSLFKTLPPSIRINTLKTSRELILNIFSKHTIIYESVDWCEEALRITNKSTRELTELEEYKQGLFYIQSLSSILVSLVLNPQPHEKVLDLTAAPGSKTSHIAALMNNTGEVVANDISRDRVFKLKSNLANLGVTNTKLINMLGEKIWSKYPEYFDRVLLDAPCSMEGRININDPATYVDWSMKKVKKLSKQQKWLLRSAVSAAKVGGTIIYSTCTLAPEENEEVIDWILEKERNKLILEKINFKGVELINGLTEWENKNYSKEINKTKRILPSDTMEGFFIAKLKKIGSNV